MPGSKLPLFPYNRGWSSTQYIPIIRIPIKGGMTIPNIATLDYVMFGFLARNPAGFLVPESKAPNGSMFFLNHFWATQ